MVAVAVRCCTHVGGLGENWVFVAIAQGVNRCEAMRVQYVKKCVVSQKILN